MPHNKKMKASRSARTILRALTTILATGLLVVWSQTPAWAIRVSSFPGLSRQCTQNSMGRSLSWRSTSFAPIMAAGRGVSQAL